MWCVVFSDGVTKYCGEEGEDEEEEGMKARESEQFVNYLKQALSDPSMVLNQTERVVGSETL